MIKYFLTIPLLISSCGFPALCEDEQVDFHVGGMLVCTSGLNVNPDHIAAAVREIELLTNQHNLDSWMDDKGTRLLFTNDYICAGGSTQLDGQGAICHRTARGYTGEQGRMIAVHYEECLASTSLAHELLHVVQYIRNDKVLDNGYEDDDHSTKQFFTGTAGPESYEFKAQAELMKVCGQ